MEREPTDMAYSSIFMEEFTDLHDLYVVPNELCVIAGDIKIHMETQTANAKQLKELVDLYDLDQHVKVPTPVACHSLDVIITPRKDGFLKDLELSHLDLSDHFLIESKLYKWVPLSKKYYCHSLKHVFWPFQGYKTQRSPFWPQSPR